MKIIYDIDEKTDFKTAVALGNFDGLHLGHQKLITTMKNLANKRKLVSTVFTFNNNISTRFKTKSDYNILLSNEKKFELLDEMGIEILYSIDFNEEIKQMSPVDFIKEIIIDKLSAEIIVVGFNFRFGYKAEGNVEYLKKMGSKLGFDVIEINPIMKDNNIISSTFIRNLLKEGKINKANEMLGKPYCITGKVVEGKGRGKKLGFATANIQLDTDFLIPKHGVYKTVTTIDNSLYESVTNVGRNPTFDDIQFSIETHLLDFNDNIYGKNIEIQFIDFLREEIKFNNLSELIEQMNKDVDMVRISK